MPALQHLISLFSLAMKAKHAPQASHCKRLLHIAVLRDGMKGNASHINFNYGPIGYPTRLHNSRCKLHPGGYNTA